MTLMDHPKIFATFQDAGIDLPGGSRAEVDTTCPACSAERKKSRQKCLSVNVDEGTWYCHHCGWSGAIAKAPGAYGAPLPKRTYTMPAPPVGGGKALDMLAWFAKRGIPEWVVEDAGISAGEEFSPSQGKAVQAIRFPYLRNGQVVNIKYRAYPKDFWMAKGAERILYGLDGIAGAEIIIVVEGEVDKLTIDTIQGWPAVSVPDGAPPPDATNYASKFSFLDGAEAQFKAAKTVILATDMDAPGQKLAEELARRIGPAKCARVTWPEGCKDANDTLMSRGPEAVMDALADAQPYPVAGVVTVRDLAGPLETLYQRGLDRGVGVGWEKFDRHLRARPGLLTIVTGQPGHGKSVLLDNMMTRLAAQHGWRFAVCSPENQPLERHLANILSIYTGKPFGDGPTPRMTVEEMRAARRWAEDHFAFVLPEVPTIDAILTLADTLLYRDGINGLLIDPWNELDHSRPDRLSETEYVSQVLSRLRHFARRAQCQVWLAAHPTKLLRDQKTKAYPVPTLYDISGSAHFKNKADAGFSVWRDEKDATQPAEVHIQKIRFAETGRLGVVNFWFDLPTATFTEAL